MIQVAPWEKYEYHPYSCRAERRQPARRFGSAGPRLDSCTWVMSDKRRWVNLPMRLESTRSWHFVPLRQLPNTARPRYSVAAAPVLPRFPTSQRGGEGPDRWRISHFVSQKDLSGKNSPYDKCFEMWRSGAAGAAVPILSWRLPAMRYTADAPLLQE